MYTGSIYSTCQASHIHIVPEVFFVHQMYPWGLCFCEGFSFPDLAVPGMKCLGVWREV